MTTIIPEGTEFRPNLIPNGLLDSGQLAPWDSRLILDTYDYPGSNLVINPGFEAVQANGSAQGWPTAGTTITYPSEAGRDGGRCARLESTGTTVTAYQTTRVPSRTGERYYLETWLKLDAGTPTANVAVMIICYNSAGGSFGRYVVIPGAQLSTTDWTKIGGYVDVSQPDIVEVRIGLRVDGQNAAVLFDDVFMAEVTNIPDIEKIRDKYAASLRTLPGAGAYSNVNGANSTFPMVGGAKYFYETWIKADKPGSRLYLELRDQNSAHAIESAEPAFDGGEGNAGQLDWTGIYLISNREVPTSWTRLSSMIKIRPGVETAKIASAYFNHPNGTERNATVWLAGVKLPDLVPFNPAPVESVWTQRARNPRWELTLLDDKENPLDTLTTVHNGTVELSSTDRLGGNATLTINEHLAEQINWQRDRVKITYRPLGEYTKWDLGVFLFTSPDYRRRLVSSYEVELQTKMLILDEASTEGPWALPAGSNLIDACVELIQSTGETKIAATPSQAVTATEIVFPTGESLLTVINTLLEAANYWACHTDGAGQFILAPYQRPSERTVSWTFKAGETSLHAPEWDRSHDQSSVPNRVEVFTPGDDETDPIIGVATNTNPDSPYSYQSRSRWITRREQVEAASQVEADELAARYLLGAMNPLAKLSVSHAVLNLRPRQVVAFESRGINTRATIQKMSIPIEFDAQVSAEWNEVNDDVDAPDRSY